MLGVDNVTHRILGWRITKVNTAESAKWIWRESLKACAQILTRHIDGTDLFGAGGAAYREKPTRAAIVESHPCAQGRAKMGRPRGRNSSLADALKRQG